VSNLIHLGTTSFGCSLDVLRGARLSSLRINSVERLIGYADGMSATAWGAYPMVPYAGRVRDGQFTHNNQLHQLHRNAEPHAIHGTVFDVAWTTTDQSPSHAVCVTSLGRRWPFRGDVEHRIEVDARERSITCTLTVRTTAASMPAQVGWHPWFVRPATLDVHFAEMYTRDADYIPDGQRKAPSDGPWDDCFVGPHRTPAVVFADGVRLDIDSDCDHWVIYNKPTHALCVEPQSGPPNGFSLAPYVITPNTPLQRTMKLIAR
jgi:aldose 1-epimerase